MIILFIRYKVRIVRFFILIVILIVDGLIQNGVLLYYCLPLDYVSTGVYQTRSENVEYIAQVLSSIIGESNYIDTTTEVVKDITVECTFSGNTLNMSVYYTIALLSDLLQTRVEIITFTGVR